MNTKLVREELYEDDYIFNEQEYKGNSIIYKLIVLRKKKKIIIYTFYNYLH